MFCWTVILLPKVDLDPMTERDGREDRRMEGDGGAFIEDGRRNGYEDGSWLYSVF